MARLDEILGRMSQPATDKTPKHLTAQIYGDAGVGKTVLALELAQTITPSEQSILYVDSREGYVSGENHEGLLEGVVRLAQEKWADIGAVTELIRSQPGAYGTVILDEFSMMTEGSLDELYRVDVGAKPGEIPVREVSTSLYKPMGDAAVRAITDLQRTGVHVILLAHARMDVDHRKVQRISPAYSPKARDAINKLCTITSHYEATIDMKGNYKRVIRNHPSVLVSAKCRIGGMPVECEPAEYIDRTWRWLNSGEAEVSEQRTLTSDELPSEGVPVAEFDEPVTVDE